MHIDELYGIFLQNPHVETDTRKLKKGEIFFALKGPNYNGNHYTKQAFKAGASWCISDEKSSYKNEKVIQVKDSLRTLQQLAKKHREQFNIPFIAITGSNGKTTTKDLVHEVLSSRYNTNTTKGNLNNHIGIPLTVLRVKQNADIALIEMGANHLGEIASYCSFTLPTHGIITNCGKSHLEGFGNEEGVRKGKGELFDYLGKNNGAAFINNDYDYLKEMSKGINNIITYGTTDASITGYIKNDNPFLEVCITKGADLPSIQTRLVGGYNLPNVLAAVCIGKLFNIVDEKARTALENYSPSNSRSQLMRSGTNTIILDAYNANPSSMKAAIVNFANMHGDKKVLILGAMMELGEVSEAEHAEIITLISKYQWHTIALAGESYKNLPANVHHFNNSSEARVWYRQQHFEDAHILIKGSRSMQMEKVIE